MSTQDKLAEALRERIAWWHQMADEMSTGDPVSLTHQLKPRDCAREVDEVLKAHDAEAAQAQAQSSEWVMVPREPTHEMIEAANSFGGRGGYNAQRGEIACEIWNDMLAAAPQPQTAEPFMYTWSKEPDKDGVFRKIPLYTHPQPAQDARDASRYRWLRGGPDVPEHSVRWPRWEVRHWGNGYWNTLFAEKLDASVDMAMNDDAAPNYVLDPQK